MFSANVTSYKRSIPWIGDAVFEDDGDSGKAAGSFPDETSVVLNLPTGCNETQKNEAIHSA